MSTGVYAIAPAVARAAAAQAASRSMVTPVWVFQHMVELSLPLDISRVSSLGHQAQERIPCWCPDISSTGERVLRRSHICITGYRSLSEHTTSFMVSSGDQLMCEGCMRLVGSPKAVTDRFAFRSHTWHHRAQLRGHRAQLSTTSQRCSSPSEAHSSQSVPLRHLAIPEGISSCMTRGDTLFRRTH